MTQFVDLTCLGMQINKTPIEVGRMLTNLGYRSKVNGTYTPTDKAFKEGLCKQEYIKVHKNKGFTQTLWHEQKTLEILGHRQTHEEDVLELSESLRRSVEVLSEPTFEDYVINVPCGTAEVPTCDFPYATFNHPTFNRVQTSILPYVDQDVNMVICSKTSTGKSNLAVMVMSYIKWTLDKPSLYVAPLKALVQEKYRDWTDPRHDFSMLNISQCSGDYQLTKQRIEELNNADIISISNEMLAVRCRNANSEKSQWLHEVHSAVYDEAHILTVTGRGDASELSMIDLATINPRCRFILLSATISNSRDIATWLSKLNGKKTVILESDWRPVELQVSFPTYKDQGMYWEKENNKMEQVLHILKDRRYKDDKFLVFFQTKASGLKAVKRLLEIGIKSAFYSADVSLEGRNELLDRFEDDKDPLRVLLSTSALAWGINCSAKHVIIVGMHRGMQEVEMYDTLQEEGRAGRPQFCKEGYAHIILPESEQDKWIERHEAGIIVDSTLALPRQREYESNSEYRLKLNDTCHNNVENALAHHMIAQISNSVNTKDKIHQWFKKTLAYHQHKEPATRKLDVVLKALVNYGLVYQKGDEYNATALGIIASRMYLSPFDVAKHNKNIKTLKESNENDFFVLSDEDVAYILSNVPSNARGYLTASDNASGVLMTQAASEYDLMDDCIVKPFTAWYQILQGDTSGYFAQMQNSLMSDAERMISALEQMNSYFNYGLDKQLKSLSIRAKYGIQGHLIGHVLIDGIGKTYAKRLYDAGIQTYEEMAESSVSDWQTALDRNVNAEKINGWRKQALYFAQHPDILAQYV